MQLSWQQCQEGWCPLLGLNLSHPHFDDMEGVYIIWEPSSKKAIRVGQGIVKDRVADHRQNEEITQYGSLLVTWASVPTSLRDGVERYLAETLRPLVGDIFPDTTPIAVNIP